MIKNTIKIIARLALLLAHLRGHVVVYESSEHLDFYLLKIIILIIILNHHNHN